MYAEQNKLEFTVPGDLIGVGTTIDPTLARGDNLVGQVLGVPGSMPDVYGELMVKLSLLHRVVGIREQQRVSRLVKGEMLRLNIGNISVEVSSLHQHRREGCTQQADQQALATY